MWSARIDRFRTNQVEVDFSSQSNLHLQPTEEHLIVVEPSPCPLMSICGGRLEMPTPWISLSRARDATARCATSISGSGVVVPRSTDSSLVFLRRRRASYRADRGLLGADAGLRPAAYSACVKWYVGAHHASDRAP